MSPLSHHETVPREQGFYKPYLVDIDGKRSFVAEREDGQEYWQFVLGGGRVKIYAMKVK